MLLIIANQTRCEYLNRCFKLHSQTSESKRIEKIRCRLISVALQCASKPNRLWCEFSVGFGRCIHIENKISIERSSWFSLGISTIKQLDRNKRKQWKKKIPRTGLVYVLPAKRKFISLNDYHFRRLLFSSLLLLLVRCRFRLLFFIFHFILWFSVCMKITGPVRCIANELHCKRLGKALFSADFAKLFTLCFICNSVNCAHTWIVCMNVRRTVQSEMDRCVPGKWREEDESRGKKAIAFEIM